MAFMNEYASKEDIAKYHLDELQREHHLANPALGWTVDRERGVFLMYGGYDRESPVPRYHFMLWRQGEVTFHWLVLDWDTPTRTLSWQYSRAFAPSYRSEEERIRWMEIKSDLKDALRTYKANGIVESKYNDYENVVFKDF